MKKTKLSTIFQYAFLGTLSVVSIFPFYWINPTAPEACDLVDLALGTVDFYTFSYYMSNVVTTHEVKDMVKGNFSAGVRNESLTNFDVIAEEAAKEGYIRPEDVARLIRFRNNPSDESWRA